VTGRKGTVHLRARLLLRKRARGKTEKAPNSDEHRGPSPDLIGNNEDGLNGTRGIRIENMPIETGPPVLNTSPGRKSLESRMRSESSSKVTILKSWRMRRIPSRKGEFLPVIMRA
jgi:hypothetical protein